EGFFRGRDKTIFDIKMAKEFLNNDYELTENSLDKSGLKKFELYEFFEDFLNNGEPARLYAYENKNNVDTLLSEKFKFPKAGKGILSFLAKNGIEINKGNINAASEYLENPEALSQYFNEIEGFASKIDNENILSGNYLGQLYSKIDFSTEGINITQKIKNMSNLQNQLEAKNIPVNIGGKITSLNMLILGGIEGKEEIDVLMGIETKNLGLVKFTMNIKNNEISLNIQNQRALAILEQNKDLLSFEGTVFTLNNINFVEP
ncbi:MAG: hypothetical protein LBV08_02485, partial [Clostridiales bacterium]|nr:hypothetical protein [Clostridiales bacterium]